MLVYRMSKEERLAGRRYRSWLQGIIYSLETYPDPPSGPGAVEVYDDTGEYAFESDPESEEYFSKLVWHAYTHIGYTDPDPEPYLTLKDALVRLRELAKFCARNWDWQRNLLASEDGHCRFLRPPSAAFLASSHRDISESLGNDLFKQKEIKIRIRQKRLALDCIKRGDFDWIGENDGQDGTIMFW